jgi:16S rRNA (guanine527-N7)-methyltransferase
MQYTSGGCTLTASEASASASYEDAEPVQGPTLLVQDELDESPVPQQVLGQAYEQMKLFHHKLAQEGEMRGLIGPRDTPILWERHILNSAAVVPYVQQALEHQHVTTGIADLGSGGGFPGIVIASCLRDVPITLIEPMERRIQWLSEVVELLGLDNVRLLRARAEDLVVHTESKTPKHRRDEISTANTDVQLSDSGEGSSNRFNVVTCRAVAPMRKLAPLAMPLLLPGGSLVALKGQSAQQEIEKARQIIKKQHGYNAQAYEAQVADGFQATHVVTVQKR